MSNTTIRTRIVTRTVEVRVCGCSAILARVSDTSVLPKRHRALVSDEGVLQTGCDRETTSTWAPGHDAKAAGILAALHRADVPVVDETGVQVPALDWAEANLTDALVAKVAHQPTRKDKPTTTIQTADGETATVRIGRDGIAREADGDRTWKPGSYLLAA